MSERHWASWPTFASERQPLAWSCNSRAPHCPDTRRSCSFTLRSRHADPVHRWCEMWGQSAGRLDPQRCGALGVVPPFLNVSGPSANLFQFCCALLGRLIAGWEAPAESHSVQGRDWPVRALLSEPPPAPLSPPLPLPLSPSPPPLVGSPSGLGFCEGELPSESSGAARASGVPNAWRRAGSSAKLSAPPRLYIAVGRPGTVGRPQSAVCQSASQPLGAKGWPASRLVAGRCSRVLLQSSAPARSCRWRVNF